MAAVGVDVIHAVTSISTTLEPPRTLAGFQGVAPGREGAWDDGTSAGAVAGGVDRPAQAVSERAAERRGVRLGGGDVHF